MCAVARNPRYPAGPAECAAARYADNLKYAAFLESLGATAVEEVRDDEFIEEKA